jgi:hypothetical protein
MAINTNEIATRLFKKLLGKGDTSTNRAFYEEAYNGPLQVFSNNVWTDTSKIPTVFLPTFRTLSGSTVQNLMLSNVNQTNAGVYTVSIQLNGCTSTTSSTTVSVNSLPIKIKITV